uniref:WD repeat containing protein 63 n=1 Tax=Echinococcus granulosus TaxID=6210 RepID=A0A068X3A6_ECHGR|nr:WD repeat containing protein 63 [Echinococcus granulosus]
MTSTFLCVAKNMKSRSSMPKGKKGAKSPTKKRASTHPRSKSAKSGKPQARKTPKHSTLPDLTEDELIKSMSTMEEEEVYDQKAINDFMAQETLPEDDVLVFKFNGLQQTTIFGAQTITRLNERIANLRMTPALAALQSDVSVADSVAMVDRPEDAVYIGLNVEKESLLRSLEHTESTDALVVAVKEKVVEYPREFITFIVDEKMKFDGNFIMILSQDLDNTLRLEDLEVNEKDLVVDVIEEADDDVTWVFPSIEHPWANQGSDLEILEEGCVETRARIVSKFERPRHEFGAKRKLNVHQEGPTYTEVKPYEDKNFSIPVMELERGVTCVNSRSDHYTNTDWLYPRNQVVQYIPRLALMEEKETSATKTLSQRPISGLSNVLSLFEQGLKENLMFNFLKDDFANLGVSDDTYDNKSANNFKEILTLSDLRFAKDKAISHIEWHPKIEGLLAMSTVERLPYDELVNQLSRVLMTPTYIIVWSLYDPIQPQLLLLAPEDILCFEFNPTDPHIVAGGCNNGEVVLWDISKYDLTNVLEKLKSKQELPLFQFDENESQKVPTMPWCATSNIEASHATPITCLQWLPDHIELDRAGLTYENTSQHCVQLLTCATDGGVFVWDLRPEKCVLAVDKTRDQMVMPHDVPATFNALDAKWKPLLHVNLFRPDNAPDHCPTCFCIRERQGDRSVLDLKANVAKKVASENDPNRVGLPKAQPLDGINSIIFVGTADGDMVCVDWMPQKDVKTAKRQTPMPSFVAQLHDGPIVYIARSPFLPEVVLCVGGFSWSLWKENVTSGPLLCSAPYAKAPTGGLWSPSRSSVFYIMRADGVLEAWDLLDKTHEPAILHTVSSSALTALSIKVEVRKHFLAVGDMHGALKILLIPHRLKVGGPEEVEAMTGYIDREVRRRAYVVSRWKRREQERMQKEAEDKHLAGISTVAELSATEKMQKMRSEYDAYLADERQFLRLLGLYGDTEVTAEEVEATPA